MHQGSEVPTDIPIKAAYRNYTPPVNAAKTVSRLLRPMPAKYLRGLDCIVLSNISAQPRRNRLGKTTSRGRRLPKSKVLGLYHQKWGGQRPWVELYVDQILRSWPKWTLWHLLQGTLRSETRSTMNLAITCIYLFAPNFEKKKTWRTTGASDS